MDGRRFNKGRPKGYTGNLSGTKTTSLGTAYLTKINKKQVYIILVNEQTLNAIKGLTCDGTIYHKLKGNVRSFEVIEENGNFTPVTNATYAKHEYLENNAKPINGFLTKVTKYYRIQD